MADPIFQLLTKYGLTREQAIHWQRHGFLT